VITSATITITVDDTAKTVNFIVSGDEGRAKTIAAYVLAMIDADKRERCGGDWGMHDRVRMVIPWDEELQRIYREHGYEILEPVEFPAPVEPLTMGELLRAARWPAAFAMVLAYSAGHMIPAGFGLAGRFILTFLIAYATMRLLMPGVFLRAENRKRNTLLA
jgi:hypothetical protein